MAINENTARPTSVPNPATTLSPSEEMSALEVDAEILEDEMRDVRFKLAELLPTIRRIRAHFAAHRGVIFRNCEDGPPLRHQTLCAIAEGDPEHHVGAR